MANKKISELPAATTPLDAADLFEVVQSGVNKKVAKSNVSSGGAWGSITGTLSSQTDLQTALDAKQTINGITTNSVSAGNLTADGNGKTGYLHLHNSTAISSNITYVLSNLTNIVAIIQTVLITGTVVISFDNSVVMEKADTRWDNTSSSKDITISAPDTGNPYIISLIKCDSLWLLRVSGAHYTS